MKHRILKLAALSAFAMGTVVHADPSATVKMIDGFVRAQNIMHAQDNAPTPGPVGACNLQGAKSACVNSADSFAFNGCSIDNGKAIVSGSWDETFSGPGADQCSATLGDGESVLRTSKGLTITGTTGESIASDTLGGTAYEGTVLPATGVTNTLSGGITTIAADGAHMIYKDKTGTQKEEVLARTTSSVHTQGVMTDGTFIVNDGIVRVFHQMDKYTSDVTLNKVAWSDKGCCHPVSGSISEAMTGSKTGTRIATFTSTCGTVQVVDTDGTTSNYTLPACQ